jgi:hypothetical protein
MKQETAVVVGSSLLIGNLLYLLSIAVLPVINTRASKTDKLNRHEIE